MSDGVFIWLVLLLAGTLCFGVAMAGEAKLRREQPVCTTDTVAVRGDTTWMEVRCISRRDK